MPDSIKSQQAQINQCYKQMDDIFHMYAIKKQLSDTAFWILFTLYESEKPYTQNDLCEEWYFSKQTIHSAVAGLVKAGLVKLEHLPGSRNSKRMALTPQGLQFAAEHIRPIQEAERTAFARLEAEERCLYLHLLKKYLFLFQEEIELIDKASKPSEDLSSQ